MQAQSTIFNPDYATVEITITDKNDNRPVFFKDRYDASVMENSKIGTKLLQVSAVDKDEVRLLQEMAIKSFYLLP